MIGIDVVAAEALERGWTSVQGNIEELLAQALQLGWETVPIRKGDPALGTLRVVHSEEAHKHSLSAMVGHGQQPLHTDGAHHRVMPDIVLLAAAGPSRTPTLLVKPSAPTESQRTGVFKVGVGPGAFYASAVDSAGRWRYDPGCMTPMDDHARQAARELDALAARAYEHSWQKSHTVLVIANRRVLHARAAAVDPDTRRVHRVALRSRLEP